MESIDNLRILVSQFNLRRHDVEFGFGLEDLQLLRVYYRHEKDREKLEALASKTIDPDCSLVMMQADICRKELLVEIEGIFLKKGEYKGSQRKYDVVDNKIRVESFELHIVEHCNLRCHMCDAMSPYNPEKFLKLEDIKKNLTFLAKHIKADIFKLMGGEPLLHPQLIDIIRLVRQSKISDKIRLTTNGLLLHKMTDEFWSSLDRLTVSNYSSSPMKPKHVQMVHEKARQFNVILNLKDIEQFNGVMIKTPIEDKERVQRIYDNCWVRHRSLVIRNGLFFKCTRAAYMDDFRREFKVVHHENDPVTYNEGDGVKMDENFFENALTYLNSIEPLNSCRYCFGASGKLIPHRQMTRQEVKDRSIDEGIFYKD
jgi:organic radical activating enzyme